MFSENKFFDYKIKHFCCTQRVEDRLGKVYLLYTCENVDNCEQPLSYLRAGVCRLCDTKELTATSCNFSLCRRVEKVCVDRQLLRYS